MQPTFKKPADITITRPSISISTTQRIRPRQDADQGQLPNQSVSKQLMSPSDVDSPSRRRKQTFITQKKVSDVESIHSQLNSYIDILDEKVYKLIEKHEAEFLVAYRNHIKKVRQEMQEIQNKALNNANSTVSQTQKIETLEKQLTIFREQSLKLFQKVNQKQRTIASLQSRIDELQSQKTHLEKSVRILTKRNKQLQGSRTQQITDKNTQRQGKQFTIYRPLEQLPMETKNTQNIQFIRTGMESTKRPYTTAINSKASVRSRNHSIQINRATKTPQLVQHNDVIINKLQQLLEKKIDAGLLDRVKGQVKAILSPGYSSANEQLDLKSVHRSEMVKNSMRKTTRSFMESKMQAKRSELEQYFYKSIETVRKQIARKRGLGSLNFYNQNTNISVSQFKKVDFFRLLQLVLSNEKIIYAVHRAIFQQSRPK